MKRGTLLSAALAACLWSAAGGCTRAIKEGVSVVTGAKGVSVIITPITADLGVYRRFEVEPFDDQTAVGVPQVIKDTLPGYVTERLLDKKIPIDGTGKTMRITGTYIYYEDANNTTDQVFGPFEELLARVRLADGDTGRTLGEAYCVGRSTTSVAKGARNKAEGLAKAIVDWIDKSYPKR